MRGGRTSDARRSSRYCLNCSRRAHGPPATDGLLLDGAVTVSDVLVLVDGSATVLLLSPTAGRDCWLLARGVLVGPRLSGRAGSGVVVTADATSSWVATE